MDDKQREDFEKWAESKGLDITAWSDGCYHSGPTQYALLGWKEQQKKIDELEKDSDELHEQIMRLRILLEEAEGVIGLYAPGFSILLENIEMALYGEKLTKEGGEE